MNPNNDSQENFIEEIEADNLTSIDDFIKELEAKEKDLHISYADMVVEIEEYDSLQEAAPAPPNVADLLETFQPREVAPLPPVAAAKPSVSEEQLKKSNREIIELRGQIRRLEKEREEMRDVLSRRQSDFESYRKRTERERGETFRNLVGNLAAQLLPVVDNLNRALDSSDASVSGKSPEFQHFVEGISMVNRQLGEVLAEMGVEVIYAVGEAFDPHLHEAAATEDSTEFPPNTVTKELLRGYRLGEKIIRHAVVKVSSGGGNNQKPAEAVATADETDFTALEIE